MTYCWLNGKILPLDEAKVSIMDIGLLRGYGIYDAVATYGNKPFRWADHLARLRESAKALNLTIPVSEPEITAAVAELIAKNGFKETNIKFILTGGNTVASIEYDPARPTFFILAEEFKPLAAENYTRGCRLISHEYQRQYPEYKTINYITGVLKQPERKAAEALEILFTWQGKILECSAANFGIVKNGTLITPAAGVLLGITRKVILELARQAGIPVEERDLAVSELATADEAFITSSFKGLVPAVTIDSITIGNGEVGPVSKKLMALFEAYAKNH